MTIKISQLATLSVVQANTVVPMVSNITGTLTTVQANVQQLQDYIVANGVSANITALYANAATQSDLIIRINANVTQANIGIIGYVDNSVLSANLAMKGYVDSISGSESIANVNMKGYVDGQITAANAGVTSANIGMKGYVDNQTYSNVQASAFLVTNLPTYQGNIGVNVNVTNGTVTADSFVGNGSQLTGIAYTMGNAVHWTSNVTTISAALDQLAERIYNIENP